MVGMWEHTLWTVGTHWEGWLTPHWNKGFYSLLNLQHPKSVQQWARNGGKWELKVRSVLDIALISNKSGS